MLVHLRPAVVMIALFTLVTGLLYPLAMTGVAQALLHGPANGSLLRDGAGHVMGSTLIAQGFAKLAQRVAGDAATLSKEAAGRRIPVDAVTTSASGLDPDVSPENARLQAPRIAAARNTTVPDVQTVLDRFTQGRALLIFGEPRVNVLEANLALDQAMPVRR